MKECRGGSFPHPADVYSRNFYATGIDDEHSNDGERHALPLIFH